jgi:hypothetical protein
MLYDKLTKGEDGLYHVRAFTDDRKKYFVQLNDVTIVDTGDEDVSFELSVTEKLDDIHDVNIQNAIDNSQEWFGKSLTKKVLTAAYTRESTLSAERLPATKIFNSEKVLVEDDGETIKHGLVCSVIVEFSGLWFAKRLSAPAGILSRLKCSRPRKSMNLRHIRRITCLWTRSKKKVLTVYKDEHVQEDFCASGYCRGRGRRHHFHAL